MRVLDLYSGQGGAGMGYHRVGFEVIGVDKHPMSRYPFEFHQLDALDVLRDLLISGNFDTGWALWDFDAFHASPPCLDRTTLKAVNRHIDHQDLVAETRELLKATGKPYVIENVVGNINGGSALIDPIRLCGSSFGLDVRRHRYFECSFPAMSLPCAHNRPKKFQTFRHGKVIDTACVPVYGTGGGKAAEHWANAMGIDWMDRAGLAQAIPPAYTEHIGGYLMSELEARAAA